MLKRYKWVLIVSSIVILLPMLLGLLGGHLLPEEIAIHWGLDGRADGFASASTAFLILPPILLVLHWACFLVAVLLDKDAAQNQKIMNIVLWIIPAISLASSGMMFSAALGHTANALAIVMLLLGVMFIVIGNYMPKMTRSRTMGIKIKWTLSSDENWQATHRFSGKVYMIVGFLCLACMPLPMAALPFVCVGMILLATLPPILYSYRFYKKQIAEGKVTKEDYEKGYRELVKNPKAAWIVTIILVPILTVFLVVFMFTGKLEVTLGEDALTVETTFSQDFSVRYEEIDAVEYRAHSVDGQRVMGFGSARLMLGTFQNKEFGTYTRYTYTGDSPCVVMTVDGKAVVISTGDTVTTLEIYEKILSEISK